MSNQLTLLYLPVDKPLTDGCMICTNTGTPFEYKESEGRGWNKDSIRVVEPFLVGYEFNVQKIVGRPSEAAMKWLKHGDKVSRIGCHPWLLNDDGSMSGVGITNIEGKDYTGSLYAWRVCCPTCGHKH